MVITHINTPSRAPASWTAAAICRFSLVREGVLNPVSFHVGKNT